MVASLLRATHVQQPESMQYASSGYTYRCMVAAIDSVSALIDRVDVCSGEHVVCAWEKLDSNVVLSRI